jgi:hypothetical protein
VLASGAMCDPANRGTLNVVDMLWVVGGQRSLETIARAGVAVDSLMIRTRGNFTGGRSNRKRPRQMRLSWSHPVRFTRLCQGASN